MGKSTLGKKIGLDWAKGLFKMFSIIFFVVLRIVKPGDSIEDVIIQQTPELEGLHVSKEKVGKMLDKFGDRCLLIFDGLDEHSLGQNEDVLKIIRNRKLPNCSIMVSSRPHSTREIENYFPTVVRVDGFTRKEAEKYVSKFFKDKDKITEILEFKPSGSREDFPVHKCPILLSFLCLLVKEEEIDLSDTKLTVGDLYLRMVQCLYKKFKIRKGVQYEKNKFLEVMKSVGKLALKTLITNNPLLQKNEVLRIAGKFAFEYGFFAGQEDFRLCTDPKVDISVTYTHRSLEEFFGSFGLIQGLSEGKSLDDILGLNCENPIFMVNPLVLRFCLWFQTQKCFNFPQDIYQKLVLFAAKQIDFRLLDTKIVEKKYPAMNVSDPLLKKDTLKLKFLKNVLKKCHRVSALNIHSGVSSYWSNYELADRVLGLMNSSLLSKLTCLSITDLPSSIYQDTFKISIDDTDPDTLHKYLNILLPKYNLLKRNPQVYAIDYNSEKLSHDLKTVMTKHIKKLHLVSAIIEPYAVLFISDQFPHCPQLTHRILKEWYIDDSVPSALIKAVQNGDLPNLKRIELIDCVVRDCDWPEVPEFLLDNRLILKIPKVLSKLTEFSDYEPSDIDLVIPVRLENLSVSKLKGIDDHNLQQVVNILAEGKLPNLTKLDIGSKGEHSGRLDKLLDGFYLHKTVKLQKLTLQQFVISAEDLEILSEKLTAIRLTELDLSRNFDFTGSLSVLFTYSFPTLNKLILRLCELNANDLQSLARANVEGKLPQLRYLDISNKYNSVLTGSLSVLFTHRFPRLDTLILAGCYLNSEDLQSLARANVEGKLPQLRHLVISHNWENIRDLFTHSAQWNQLTSLKTSNLDILNVDSESLISLEELILKERGMQPPSVSRRWSSLKVIEIDSKDFAHCIADGVERGMFPSLTTVRCKDFNYRKPFFFKFLKANISVEWIP